MANKFAKAVEQRNSSEHEQPKKAESPVKEIESSVVKTEPEEKEPSTSFDLDSIIKKEPKETRRNKTYYLDEKVIIGILKMAKKQKISESKLVNDILAHILFSK